MCQTELLVKNMLQEEKSANVVQHLSNFTKLNENVGLQWEIPVGEDYVMTMYNGKSLRLGEVKCGIRCGRGQNWVVTFGPGWKIPSICQTVQEQRATGS